jgi:serine protease Do
LLEELRKEVSGLRLGMSRSELDSIQESMARAAGLVTRFVVGIRPAAGAQSQPLRPIPLYSDMQEQKSALPSSASLSPGISGIVIDPQGYVLTSGNVARLGSRVQLIFSDGTVVEGETAGFDAEEFVALLKISPLPANLATPDFSRGPSDLRPGEWLIRQGRSPLGRDSFSLCLLESVRLTQKDRPVGFLDSAGSPEIDGGPVVDLSGRIKGLYVSPPQAPAFVVPIERALVTAKRLMAESGRIPSSWLGVEFQDLTADLRQYFGVESGVLVTRVSPDGPAARGGLLPSDIVQTIDENTVTSASQLAASIAEKPPGTAIGLGIHRAARNRTINVVTTSYSAEPTLPSTEDQTLSLKMQDTATLDGPVIVGAGPPELANRLGLRAGDAIKAVNGRSIRTAADLIRLLRTLPAEKPVLFQIQRGERIFFLAFKEPLRIDG